MASRWFCRVGGREVGPVTFQEMAQLVRDGQLAEGDRVRREISSEWTAAREVVGLFRVAAAPAATQPEPPPPPQPKPAPLRPAAKPSPPSDPRKRLVRAAWIGGFVMVVIAVVIVWRSWPRRVTPFPESRMGKGLPPTLAELETFRRSRPGACSVPGLDERVATPVPGLDQVDPGYASWLTPDLRSIVFSSMLDLKYAYDLYHAARDDVSQPFGKPKLISSCQTHDLDAYGTLSPDGLELIFQRSDRRPQFLVARRVTTSGEFGAPVPWPIPGHDPEKTRIDWPRFLDAQHVMYTALDVKTNTRQVRVVERSSPAGEFKEHRPILFADPWPPWFVGSSGLRAYHGRHDGLYLAFRKSKDAAFGEGTQVLDAAVTGPIDGPVWVTPQEDVVFYISPGPGKKPGPYEMDKGRKLWMLRF